jgi:lysophospholipase L1-like esterase
VSSRRIVVGVLLVASLLANVGLSLACRELYRREQRVRLHPTFPAPAAVARSSQRTQVLFLGDSRMEEWPDLRKDRFVTINAGGPGETTAQIRLRAASALDAAQPELVVFQAGINDLKAIGALPEQARDIEAKCLANSIALVELCRARGARVVLVPILPAAQPSLVRRVVWSSEIDAARVRINAELRRRFAGNDGVVMLTEPLLVVGDDDYRDTLHFTPEAYRKLEAATLAAIDAFGRAP